MSERKLERDKTDPLCFGNRCKLFSSSASTKQNYVILQLKYAYQNLVTLQFEKGCQVKEIGSYASAHCKYLETVFFCFNNLKIGKGGFFNCTSLKIIYF